MKPTAELITLVDKCLLQNISRVEMAHLEILLGDDDNLQYYLRIVEVEGNLPSSLEAGVIVQSHRSTTDLYKQFIRPLSIAAAAAIIFYIGIYVGRPLSEKTEMIASSHSPNNASNAASITSLVGVTWEDKAPESFQLSTNSDAIAFTSGIVELSFSSGVRSLVEGPALIRITGENSAILERGRMVSEVPKGAEGFTVEYPDGKVVDLGTEFAIYVPQNQHGAEVGVFRGEVEIYDHNQNTAFKILENHAVVQIIGARHPFTSIPFHREQYIRELPTSELPWKLPENLAEEPYTMDFDVSHLVWRLGTYRTILKYMHGADALHIHKAELLLNDQIISTDVHKGITGLALDTHGNSYSFNVPEDKYKRGKWTVRITADPDSRGQKAAGSFYPDSSGIMLFKAPSTTDNTEEAFLGTWEYSHNGDIHRRVFTADHRAQYFFNGEKTTLFDAASWELKDGILILTIPPHNTNTPQKHQELHLLKNADELIFINRPYRNALKLK